MSRLAALLAALLLLTDCGGSTGGGLIEVPIACGGVAREAAGPLTFTTPLGWQVQLTRARMALGPLYFNVAPPPTSAFRGGVVLLELTRQQVVDLLDPSLQQLQEPLRGQTGHAVSVEIGLLPPDETSSQADRDLLDEGFAWVEGEASREGEVIPFAGALTIDRSLVTPQAPLASLQRVKGASVDLAFGEEPFRLEMRVDPTHLFDTADFSLIRSGPLDDAGRRGWIVKSAFQAQLIAGARAQTGVYGFRTAPVAAR